MVNMFLKGLRAGQGLDQKQMAVNLKIDKATYCNKENGKANFTVDEYIKMANLLNVELEKLIMGGQ